MADGVCLPDTLNSIVTLIEQLVPDALCSVMGVKHNGTHLTPISARNLPSAYLAAIANVEIGPGGGSCGTAAFRKEPVIVTDIASDPLWDSYRAFALPFGLRACWSLPVLHIDGSVLATVALYYREPRPPTEQELALVRPCITTIRLAIITDRKQYALRTSEARWRLGAEVLEIGTYDADLVESKSTWSPSLRRMLGVSDEAEASYAAFLERVVPEDRHLKSQFMPNFPEPPFISPWRCTLRIRKADSGIERILENHGCTLTNEDGKPIHLIGMLTDVTEQHERERELKEAKLAAESANAAKSKFLASMSHELRTPLNAVIGFSDMIRSRIFGSVSPPRYAEYIDDIYKSGTHLLSLINDVLDMAKIEAQRFELRRTEILLSELTDSALLLVRPQALAKGICLELDITPGVVLLVDGRAMRQVLTNFLSNAIKFTNSGGTVRLFTEHLTGGGLALGVEDNGAGMNEEGLAVALEPFGQVQMDIATDRAGTGLGLPIAKALIEYHGALFRITSAPGHGTRVWAEFPPTDVSSTAQRSA
ncbi:MAG: ATP-binding protein [Rhizomicrobium sp.]|nr:ATP-binding protein [Rhizomicrobium sp.]